MLLSNLETDLLFDHQKQINPSFIDHSEKVINRSLNSITFRSKHFKNFSLFLYFLSFKVEIMKCLNKTQWIAVNYFFDVFAGLSIQQRQHFPFRQRRRKKSSSAYYYTKQKGLPAYPLYDLKLKSYGTVYSRSFGVSHQYASSFS